MWECCSSWNNFTAHVKKYSGFYYLLLFLTIFLIIFASFSTIILDKGIKFLESIGIEENNLGHMIAYLCITIVIYLPQPILCQLLYFSAMGFYFKYWSFLLMAISQFIGAVQAWIQGKLMRKFKLEHWLMNKEEFKMIDGVMKVRPYFLVFSLMWLPFQSQFNIHIPVVFSDVDLQTFLIGAILGNYTVQLQYLFVGIYAKDLADVIKSSTLGTVLIVASFIMVGLVITILSRYIQNQLNEQILNKEEIEHDVI